MLFVLAGFPHFGVVSCEGYVCRDKYVLGEVGCFFTVCGNYPSLLQYAFGNIFMVQSTLVETLKNVTTTDKMLFHEAAPEETTRTALKQCQ